jgi:NAD(P)H-quinone oxidoreductase subunit 5
MSLLSTLAAAAAITSPLMAAALARASAPQQTERLARAAGGTAFGSALALAGLVYAAGPAGSGTLGLRFDFLSASMGVLVSFLALAVLRFSRRYLAGDPQAVRFHRWLSLTFAAVLLLAFAGNLLVLFAAWVATSLALDRLLRLYPGRPGAVYAARKKFVVSRLGDLCLVGALLAVDRAYGTWDLGALFAAAAAGHTAPLSGICLWLAAGAAMKSAQVPFHSWLPDTMETPTPVSAFMHAGIINAGGFLVIRLSPLFGHAPGALTLLALVGALTAAYGAVVMLAQPSIKRALAYSTVAQMGFMLLECGLGAFGLAFLHLVAHSLYKAHAFLNSGGTVDAPPRAAVPLRTPALVGAVATMGTAAWAVIAASGHDRAADMFPVMVLALAAAYGLARTWSAAAHARPVVIAACLALLFLGAGLVLHRSAAALIPPGPTPPDSWLIAACGSVFAALFAFQAVLWRTSRRIAGQALYIHALNGFYLGTLNNRMLRLFWPAFAQR